MEQDVQIPIAIIVSPGRRTGGEAIERGDNVHKSAVAGVTIDSCLRPIVGVDTRNQQVQVAIVIVIAPGEHTAAQGGERNAALDQYPVVVAQEFGDGNVVGFAADDQVRVAVIVKISPGEAAETQGGQNGG